jgi:hypothetical protein
VSLWESAEIEYAVYISVPVGDDAGLIAAAGAEFAPDGSEFALREHGDPSQSVDGELYFRISGVGHPDQALARALEVYAAGRREAGLGPDRRAQASLVPLTRDSGEEE